MSAEEVKEWSGRNKPGMPLFPGPQMIREKFILYKGIDWTASYIDPSTWLSASQTVVAKTQIGYRRILEQGSGVCDLLHIKVRPPASHARIASE